MDTWLIYIRDYHFFLQYEYAVDIPPLSVIQSTPALTCSSLAGAGHTKLMHCEGFYSTLTDVDRVWIHYDSAIDEDIDRL